MGRVVRDVPRTLEVRGTSLTGATRPRLEKLKTFSNLLLTHI